jgi:hypothetical protein
MARGGSIPSLATILDVMDLIVADYMVVKFLPTILISRFFRGTDFRVQGGLAPHDLTQNIRLLQ